MSEKRPRWESEMMGGPSIPKDILCKMCMFQTPPIMVDGETYERYTRGNCKIFEEPEYKPHEILWEHGDCEYYEAEA